MSCRKQHFIFITKVETGVSVQNQNISVELYSQVDKMTTFLYVLPPLTETRTPPWVSYQSHFVWLMWCELGGGWPIRGLYFRLWPMRGRWQRQCLRVFKWQYIISRGTGGTTYTNEHCHYNQKSPQWLWTRNIILTTKICFRFYLMHLHLSSV